jgi:CheY-like chemotaxis protein
LHSAVRHIRSHANKAVRDVKIIALTANAVSGDEQRFLNIGMDKYLSKPVRATKLEEAILNCLSGL